MIQLDEVQKKMWEQLTGFLREQKIKYTVSQVYSLLILQIKTPKLRGEYITGYVTMLDWLFPVCLHCLYLDRRELFDKTGTCPIKFDITSGDWNSLTLGIQLLLSEEGYKISRSYGYIKTDPYVGRVGG